MITLIYKNVSRYNMKFRTMVRLIRIFFFRLMPIAIFRRINSERRRLTVQMSMWNMEVSKWSSSASGCFRTLHISSFSSATRRSRVTLMSSLDAVEENEETFRLKADTPQDIFG